MVGYHAMAIDVPTIIKQFEPEPTRRSQLNPVHIGAARTCHSIGCRKARDYHTVRKVKNRRIITNEGGCD